MTVVRFDVIQPRTVAEAVAALQQAGELAQPVAGGTDILRDLRLGSKKLELLVSLDRVADLAGVRQEDDGAFTIGATTTMAHLAGSTPVVERLSALADAAGWMGSPQVRNRATFGGNLCNARPCADTAPPAMVLGAELELQGPAGSRRVPAGEFMTGPGQTVRRGEELLRAVRFPAPAPHSGSAFFTVTNRKAVEITITSAAAWLRLEEAGGPVVEARVALGSVAPRPIRAPGAEAELVGKVPDEAVLQAAARAAVADATPIDDLRAAAVYRRWMVEAMVKRALLRALERCGRQTP